MTNQQICHRCLLAAGTLAGCRGECPCVADGRDIREHARAADCPRGLHRPVAAVILSLPGFPLAGDLFEQLAKKIGADRLARWWEKKTGRPCGCAQRKEKLNDATRALARLARWMGIRSAAAPAADPARSAVKGPSSQH